MIFLGNCTHKNVKPRKSRQWGFGSTLTPTHLFAVRGRWKEIFNFSKLLWGRDWLQLNEKKSMENQTRLMSWYWKRKSTWRKDLMLYNSHPRIMFYFNWLVIIWREKRGEGPFEIDRTRSRGQKNFGRGWTRRWGVFQTAQFSWTYLI